MRSLHVGSIPHCVPEQLEANNQGGKVGMPLTITMLEGRILAKTDSACDSHKTIVTMILIKECRSGQKRLLAAAGNCCSEYTVVVLQLQTSGVDGRHMTFKITMRLLHTGGAKLGMMQVQYCQCAMRLADRPTTVWL